MNEPANRAGREEAEIRNDAGDAANRRPGRSRTVVRAALYLFVLLALAGAGFQWILVPAFQPPVDPGLVDLDIRRIPDVEDPASHVPAAELRGSITDMLFDGTLDQGEHPLDPVLAVARRGLQRIQTDIRDYTALMVKQERVNGTLMNEETIRIKVRHPWKGAEEAIPKSFYLKFEKPRSMTGREVIWVQGQNADRLIAHEGGIKNLFRVNLAPESFLAMAGNRYPITELGIETLIQRMIEKGERDRKFDECEVAVERDIEIDGHKCTMITITHPRRNDRFEFHQAKIYVDDEIDLPVGYEGFDWPEQTGGEPVLMERYFYRELATNVGLSDLDFDPENPDYRFP
jgi:hypothetical protein